MIETVLNADGLDGNLLRPREGPAPQRVEDLGVGQLCGIKPPLELCFNPRNGRAALSQDYPLVPAQERLPVSR